MIDRNARFSYQTCPERMEFEDFYVYIEFYCVHTFHELPRMLVYDRYHKVSIYDGLVEDLDPTSYNFADIIIVEYLCAEVTDHEGKIYFVDA